MKAECSNDGDDPMTTEAAIKATTYDVGMTVVRRGGHRPEPERIGTVVSVARKYCTVRLDRPHGGHVDVRFDKETGLEEGDLNYPQRLTRIKTPDEWAAVDRRFALLDALHAAGVRFALGHTMTDEQISGIATVMGIEQ